MLEQSVGILSQEDVTRLLATRAPKKRLRPSLTSYIDPEFSVELSAYIEEYPYELQFYEYKEENRSLMIIAGAYPYVMDIIDISYTKDSLEKQVSQLKDIFASAPSDFDEINKIVSETDKLFHSLGRLVLKMKNENDQRLQEVGKIYEIIKLYRELIIIEKDANDPTFQEPQWSFGENSC